MKLNLAKEYDIVPEWNGNKTDPEPVKIRCRYLTASQKDQAFKVEYYSEAGEMKNRFCPDKVALLKAAIVRVDNLTINGHFVGGADDLMMEQRLAPLVAEIYGAVIEQETAGENDLKN